MSLSNDLPNNARWQTLCQPVPLPKHDIHEPLREMDDRQGSTSEWCGDNLGKLKLNSLSQFDWEKDPAYKKLVGYIKGFDHEGEPGTPPEDRGVQWKYPRTEQDMAHGLDRELIGPVFDILHDVLDLESTKQKYPHNIAPCLEILRETIVKIKRNQNSPSHETDKKKTIIRSNPGKTPLKETGSEGGDNTDDIKGPKSKLKTPKERSSTSNKANADGEVRFDITFCAAPWGDGIVPDRNYEFVPRGVLWDETTLFTLKALVVIEQKNYRTIDTARLQLFARERIAIGSSGPLDLGLGPTRAMLQQVIRYSDHAGTPYVCLADYATLIIMFVPCLLVAGDAKDNIDATGELPALRSSMQAYANLAHSKGGASTSTSPSGVKNRRAMQDANTIQWAIVGRSKARLALAFMLMKASIEMKNLVSSKLPM